MMMADVQDEIRALQHHLYDLSLRVSGGVVCEHLPEGDLTLLLCRIGAGRVGFLQQALEEILPVPAVAPIPESPPWIAGSLKLRGRKLTVVDVLAWSERRRRRRTLASFVVVASQGERRVGLLVQDIEELRRVPRSHFELPPRDLPLAPYLLGMVRLPDGAHFMTVPVVSIRRLIAATDHLDEAV